jgi:hypothetical protein
MSKIFFSRENPVAINALVRAIQTAFPLQTEGASDMVRVSGLVRVDFVTQPIQAVIDAVQAIIDAHDGSDPVKIVQDGAEGMVIAIPLWAHYREDEAQTWWETNIHGPLVTGRTNLPVTLTLASTRVVIVALLDILDKMAAMMWAMARMIIALRNNTWPGLQNPPA